MDDNHASDATMQAAKKRYDEILRKELELSSRLLTYISQWSIFKKTPTPPSSVE